MTSGVGVNGPLEPFRPKDTHDSAVLPAEVYLHPPRNPDEERAFTLWLLCGVLAGVALDTIACWGVVRWLRRWRR